MTSLGPQGLETLQNLSPRRQDRLLGTASLPGAGVTRRHPAGVNRLLTQVE